MLTPLIQPSEGTAKRSREQGNVLTLAEVPIGTTVRVVSLPDHTPFGRRLMEVGLVPGCETSVTGRAPLQDPIQISVMGALLAIRKADALEVGVISLTHGN
jgi:ferrous iron transport protein A